MMTRLVTLVACVALLGWLTVEIVRASGTDDVITGFGRVLDLAWGRVGLLDLYIGLLFMGAWIHALERRWRRVLPWWVALFFLGNGATLIYLGLRTWRYPTLAAALTEHRDPSPATALTS